MTTQEEVKLRIGVDGSQVAPEMGKIGATIGGTFERSMAKSLKSIKRMMTFNLTSMAIGLAQDLLPTVEEMWNKFYGVDESGSKALKESLGNIRKIRNELLKSKKDAEKTLFELMTPAEQEASLKSRMRDSAKDVAQKQKIFDKAKAEEDLWKKSPMASQGNPLRAWEAEARRKATEARAKAETELNEALTDQGKILGDLKKAEAAVSKGDSQSQLEFIRQKLKQNTEEAIRLRQLLSEAMLGSDPSKIRAISDRLSGIAEKNQALVADIPAVKMMTDVLSKLSGIIPGVPGVKPPSEESTALAQMLRESILNVRIRAIDE